jgi:hypothetical protein
LFLKSSGGGKISMSKAWQRNQHINAEKLFLNIVSEETARITGKILLPAQGAGKVKNISLVPIAMQQGKFTMVEVEFPENLTTNYGKTLDFSQEMSGTAEIISEDLRLIERLLNPVRAAGGW